MERIRAQELAPAAGLRSLQTEQAQDIGDRIAEAVVHVEAALHVAHGEARPFRRVLPGIAHVIEQRAFHILGKRHAEKLADHPVDHLRFVTRVTLERQPLDDGETSSSFQRIKRTFQNRGTGGKVRALHARLRNWLRLAVPLGQKVV